LHEALILHNFHEKTALNSPLKGPANGLVMGLEKISDFLWKKVLTGGV